jgi:hypothetical protein
MRYSVSVCVTPPGGDPRDDHNVPPKNAGKERNMSPLPPGMVPDKDSRRTCDPPTRPESARITAICDRIARSGTRGELGAALAREVGHYSMYDLQVICGRLQHEISRLPSPYRESIRPFFMEQLFGLHHRLLLMDREGSFLSMTDPVPHHDLFLAFCRMVPEGCFRWDDGREYVAHLYSPFHRLFYHVRARAPGTSCGNTIPGRFPGRATGRPLLLPHQG